MRAPAPPHPSRQARSAHTTTSNLQVFKKMFQKRMVGYQSIGYSEGVTDQLELALTGSEVAQPFPVPL